MIAKTALHAHNERKNLWFIDNNCSSHTTGDRSTFMNFKEFEGGSVTFENNSIAKISSKGTLSFDGCKTKTHDVLYVEGLNHNFLSFSHICDKGY